MATPTAKSPESDKSKKYDRQLRLWGEHGQAALEGAQVCLINATATGTEILKDIVLPGVGSFTILDGNKITGEDVGNNFFLDRDSIGKSRAQVATGLLMEMNVDVKGDFVEESPEQMLENNPTFFHNFSLVIATNMIESTLLKLADKLWEYNISLLVCRTYGMIGYIRIQVKEHTVVESHPDNAHSDLWLDRPFPELLSYCKLIDFNTTDKKLHSHIPYVAIILKYLEEWKEKHDGSVPKTYKEKNELKELIRTGIRRKEDIDVEEDEENFEEAIKAVNSVLVPTMVPQEIQDLLSCDACINLTPDSKPFWIMTKALKMFVENEGNGYLPVQGSIPDMTADSERYISLQNVYKERANRDVEVIFSHTQQILQDLGKPQDFITEAEIRSYCKNARFLRVINGTSLRDEYDPKTARIQEIVRNLDNPDSEMIFYSLLRAVDRFYRDYNRYPGIFNDQVEPDITLLKGCFCKILQEWNCGQMSKDDYIHEMCKYGASEPHSIAAYIGGCAAHEVVKLLTNQYVPLNNTYIYNAIAATSATFLL